MVERARRQAGAVTVAQAVDLGVPRSTFWRHVDTHGWTRPFPGVALLPGAGLTARSRAVAAALAVGDEVVVTGRTSLALHGVLDASPARVELVLPWRLRRRKPAGVSLQRSRTLEGTDAAPFDGVQLAGVPRAFLDAAPRLELPALRAALIDGRQRGHVHIDRVHERAARAVATPGRGRLLAACHDVARSGADSELVRRVEAWLLAEGFPLDAPPRTVHVGDRDLHPDITITGSPVAIEVDGVAFHASRRALDLDQRKHNRYLLAGWLVLRITWDRFHQDPQGFLSELREAIDRGRA